MVTCPQKDQPRLRLCTFPHPADQRQLSTQAGKSACAAVKLPELGVPWCCVGHAAKLQPLSTAGRSKAPWEARIGPPALGTASRRWKHTHAWVQYSVLHLGNITGVHDSTMDLLQSNHTSTDLGLSARPPNRRITACECVR